MHEISGLMLNDMIKYGMIFSRLMIIIMIIIMISLAIRCRLAVDFKSQSMSDRTLIRIKIIIIQ